MELEKEFTNCNLEKRRIIYPAYRTTLRFHNLYSDVRTFVRELIQNADDADADSIQFKINLRNSREIEVINNGHSFNSNDIERLLTPCLGGKDLDKTGAMNLGALSVLSISDEPQYHSGNTLLKFVMDHDSEDFVAYINENYDLHFSGTRLILPFHSRLSSDDLKKLDKIDEYLTQYSHLLFTRRLKNITLNYPHKKIEITKKIENEIKIKQNGVEAFLTNITITEKHANSKGQHVRVNNWLVVKRIAKIPEKFFSKKELEQFTGEIKLPVYFAFAIENDLLRRVDYPIYIIFPSDTLFGLGCILSSNFKPETSRKGFSTEGLDGEFNAFLLRNASELYEQVLIYFKKKISAYPIEKRKKFFNSLLETIYYRDTYSSMEPYVKEHIYSKATKFLEKNILDCNGNWTKALKIAIVEPKLKSFFSDQYKFISAPTNERIKELLKSVGVKEIGFKDLIKKLLNDEIKSTSDLLKVWSFLSTHQNNLDKEIKLKLLSYNTLPNRLGKLTPPRMLVIPHEDAIGLYNSLKELKSEFVKDISIKSFLRKLGIKHLKHKEILEYFVSIKYRLSVKNLELVKNYYKYFYKFGLLDKKREIVLTNQGFRNPNEAFFNRVIITNIVKNKIPLVPRNLESSRICKMYLENLGVSKEITAKFVVKHIKKYGSAVISLDVLRFLSEHVHQLSNRDISGLERMALIPTTNNMFVRPSECYLLNDENKKILGNLVNYFDPKDENNKEWLKFFKKIGIAKEPRIIHLRMALKEALNTYKTLSKSEEDNVNKTLERIELIFQSISKNDQKEEKENLLLELQKIKSIPTTKGLKKPWDTYLRDKKFLTLLGQSVPYPLIKIPDKLVVKLGLNKKPVAQDVANYLLDTLTKLKVSSSEDFFNEAPVQIFDKIYSYLGRTENFNRLQTRTKRRLMTGSIVYLSKFDCFEKGTRIIMYSREAELIYGDNRNIIKYSDYPNSLNFFRKIGVMTSINTDDIADFLIEYVSQGVIETQRLFMLYNIIGTRYRFLSNKKRLKLKNSKIVLTEDLNSFAYPNKIFIPDDKTLVEKFPSIKVATVNNKILEFLENIEVRKVSEVVTKNILFSGVAIEDDYSKRLSQKIKELLPFIDTIEKDSNFSLDKDWKRRLQKLKCVSCDQILYELQYKSKRSKIQGRTVEYDPRKKIIGIAKNTKENLPIRFLTDLSKAISSLLFINSISSAKIMSPLIEKLLQSEDIIQTLRELGFSTFKLEAKKYNIPNAKLILPKITESPNSLATKYNSVQNLPKYKNYPKIRQSLKSTPFSWSPKKFNIIQQNYPSEKQKRSGTSIQKPIIKRMDEIDVILKGPPSQNQIIKYIKNKINTTLDYGRISNQYKINATMKNTLKKFDKKLIKTMEFPGRAVYGGLDITPPIPKLNLEKVDGLYFYKQEGLTWSVPHTFLKKFEKMLQFIVMAMEGNPKTVSVAIFNAPINAFNYNGQLIFNYLLMSENGSLEIPSFLIWIFVVAHELAHNFSENHDQQHSKYMTIFAIRGIQKLQSISKKYLQVFDVKYSQKNQ